MLNGYRNRCISVKRNTSGHHLIHHNAKWIDITSAVHKSVSCLLRRRIMDRSHYIGTDRVAWCGSGNTKVRNFYFSFCRDNNILWLNITVCDLLIMCSLDASCHLDGNTYRLFKGQLSLFLDICLKGDSLHIFHNNIMEPLLTSYIIDIDNVWMLKSRCGLCLRTKLCNKTSIFRKLIAQHFDCDKPSQNMVLCFIYIRHSACTDLTHDLISIC